MQFCSFNVGIVCKQSYNADVSHPLFGILLNVQPVAFLQHINRNNGPKPSECRNKIEGNLLK